MLFHITETKNWVSSKICDPILSFKLKADWPHPRDYPHMQQNYRHAHKLIPHTDSGHSLQASKRMDKQTLTSQSIITAHSFGGPNIPHIYIAWIEPHNFRHPMFLDFDFGREGVCRKWSSSFFYYFRHWTPSLCI